MRGIVSGGVALVSMLLVAASVSAAPLKLNPASKQSGFKSGLNVKYAHAGPPPARIQSLDEAKQMLSSAKPGTALRGLDYRDTQDGQPVLTFKEPYNVAADIRGYIKFPDAGIYQIEVWSNDGVDARIDGQRVGYYQGRQSCQGNVIMEVEVPKAGWYPLQIAYFQKYSSSCLMMRWAKKGQKLSWVPNSAFGR